jgi:4-nitrophenyl phosphatase
MTADERPTSGTWLIDLDGVVWLADDPIPGSRDALAALRSSGHKVAYFTNNSFSTRKQLLDKFAAHGIELDPSDLLSSAQAAAELIDPGSKVTILGGRGIEEAVAARGIEYVPLETVAKGDHIDAVLVGLDRQLTFARLTAACRAVESGARLIGTNDDATYPTPDGHLPGGGSILAAVSWATSTTAVVAGKPYPPAIELINRHLGSVAVMVGDRPETDGALARGLGARYGLVRSGVVGAGIAVDPPPDYDEPDLETLVKTLIA